MAGNGFAPIDASVRRRRNAPRASVVLPADGREGGPPVWPLASPEPAAWEELWRLPQAVEWERFGFVRLVARYAMFAEQTEYGTATAALLNEVRQLEDRLGLNPKSMRSLGWVIAEPAGVTSIRPRLGDRSLTPIKDPRHLLQSDPTA